MSKMMKYLIGVILILCLVKACGGDETVADVKHTKSNQVTSSVSNESKDLTEFKKYADKIYFNIAKVEKVHLDNFRLIKQAGIVSDKAKKKEVLSKMEPGENITLYTPEFAKAFETAAKKYENGKMSMKEFSKYLKEFHSVTISLIVAHEVYAPLNYGIANPDVYKLETKVVDSFKEVDERYNGKCSYQGYVDNAFERVNNASKYFVLQQL
jgi:hypothetical protein